MIEGAIEQIKSDRNWEKVELWRKGIILGEICPYMAFHLRRPFSLRSTGISGIGAESLDFTGLKVKVQGSGMPKQLKNVKIIPERQKLQEREQQNLSTNIIQFHAWTLTYVGVR